jgi:hypothetical protein
MVRLLEVVPPGPMTLKNFISHSETAEAIRHFTQTPVVQSRNLHFVCGAVKISGEISP